MTTAMFGLLGGGFGVGLLLIRIGLTPRLHPPATTTTAIGVWARRAPGRRLAAIAAGTAVAAATGWIVAGVLAALAVMGIPTLLGRNADHRTYLARVDAVATWAETLRDTLVAAAGLEQAIRATAANPPQAIANEITELDHRIGRGDKLGAALRHLGDRLSDPTADLVIAALVLAADHHARNLADLLGELADQARAEAAMRARVDAQRARARTSVRVIVATTLAFAAGLVVLNRTYLAPYDTATGQLVLACVGALFITAFCWLARISRHQPAERVLATNPIEAGATR